MLIFRDQWQIQDFQTGVWVGLFFFFYFIFLFYSKLGGVIIPQPSQGPIFSEQEFIKSQPQTIDLSEKGDGIFQQSFFKEIGTKSCISKHFL